MASRPRIPREIHDLAVHNYRLLLSGDPKKVRKARRFIDEQRKLSSLAGTIDLIDGSKLWLGHDRKALKKSFLKALLKDADTYLANAPGLWEVQSRVARVLRLAGRFEEAETGYTSSIEALTKTGDHPSELCDIMADYAEYLVCIGYPEEAIEMLDKIKRIDAPQMAWYEWVRGFALHQLAFSSKYPIGKAVGYNPLGENAAYSASLDVLNNALRVRGPLAIDPAQVPDVYLLVAANYGAKVRLGSSPAKDKAKEALKTFARGTPPNDDWSLKKEERGKFAAGVLPVDSGDDKLVDAWRQAYQEHYLQNLLAAGVPRVGSVDGETYP